jgi:type III pantothenate kinase
MNDEEKLILAADIGSSRTHLAAVDIQNLSYAEASNGALCLDRIDFDNADFDELFMRSVKQILLSRPHIKEMKISSCIKKLAAKAKAECEQENLFSNVTLAGARDNMPVRFRYNLQTLGPDRACNALACAALFSGESCVIIDSGTAITIDYLLNGKTFIGGAILPGCAMQINALHCGTDALPSIKLAPDDAGKGTITIPAATTEECIKAGVLYGTAGAIERCVAECLGAADSSNVRIVATGGGWGLTAPFVKADRNIIAIPDLTLIGAAVFETEK